MLGTATFPAVTSRSAIPNPKLVAINVQAGLGPEAFRSAWAGTTRWAVIGLSCCILHGCTAASYGALELVLAIHARMHGDAGLG